MLVFPVFLNLRAVQNSPRTDFTKEYVNRKQGIFANSTSVTTVTEKLDKEALSHIHKHPSCSISDPEEQSLT